VPFRHQLQHGHRSGCDDAAGNRPSLASANDQLRRSNHGMPSVNEMGKQATAAKGSNGSLIAGSQGNLPAATCDRPRGRNRNSISVPSLGKDAADRDQLHRSVQRSNCSINAGSHGNLPAAARDRPRCLLGNSISAVTSSRDAADHDQLHRSKRSFQGEAERSVPAPIPGYDQLQRSNHSMRTGNERFKQSGLFEEGRRQGL